MAEEIGRFSLARAFVSPKMLRLAAEAACKAATCELESLKIVSRPERLEEFMSRCAGVRLQEGEAVEKKGPPWVQSWDIPLDVIHIETPKGVYVVHDLSPVRCYAD